MTEFVITINYRKHTVKVSENSSVEIGDKKVETEISQISNNFYLIRFGNSVFEVIANKLDRDKYGFLIDGFYFETIIRTQLEETVIELQKKKSKIRHHSDVKAPMPGLLLKLKKGIGDQVSLGEPLLLLEAMKMENELRSPASGRVKNIFFREGQSIEKDAIILTIE